MESSALEWTTALENELPQNDYTAASSCVLTPESYTGRPSHISHSSATNVATVSGPQGNNSAGTGRKFRAKKARSNDVNATTKSPPTKRNRPGENSDGAIGKHGKSIATTESSSSMQKKKRKKRGKTKSKTDNNSRAVNRCADEIANKIKEKNRLAIKKMVEVLGLDEAKKLMTQALKIQGDGGMFTETATRKRTTGGIMFLLLKDRVTNERYQYIFSHNKERDKLRKKRQLQRAKENGKTQHKSISASKHIEGSSEASVETPIFFKATKSLNEILGMEEGECAQ